MNLIYLKDGVKKAHLTKNLQELERLMNHPTQVSNLAKARNGDNAAKKQLIQANFSAYLEEGQLLKGAKTPSHLCAIDIDFDPKSELTEEQMLINETVQAWYKHKRDELIAKVMEFADMIGLVMCQVSSRGHGLHIVFLRVRDLSQIQNLDKVSEILGVPYDKNAKDITRVFYLTSMKDMYIHNPEALFAHEAFPIVEEPVVKVQAQKIQVADTNLLTLNKTKFMQEQTSVEDNGDMVMSNFITFDKNTGEVKYKGVSSKTIMQKWLNENFPTPPQEGERNNSTLGAAIVAASLGFDAETALEVVPNWFDNTEAGIKEWQRTVANGVRIGKGKQPLSSVEMIALQLQDISLVELTGGTLTTPPVFPENLPEVLELATSKCPDYCKPAVAIASMSALGVYFADGDVRVQYFTNEEFNPASLTCCIASSSAGKSCIEKPVNAIMDDIIKQDAIARKKDNEWRACKRKKGDKADDRPSDICVQMLPANITTAALNQALNDAEQNGQKTLLFLMKELDDLLGAAEGKLEKLGLLLRNSFDRAKGGQIRVGAECVNVYVTHKINIAAATTPESAEIMFGGKRLKDGALNRMKFSTIEEPPYDEIPVYGTYDEAYTQAFAPYRKRLKEAHGLIVCPEALEMARTLYLKYAAIASQDKTNTYIDIIRRQTVIALFEAVTLYVCNEKKWSDEIANYFEWTLGYGIWTTIFFFGEAYKKRNAKGKRVGGKKSLYDQLPHVFTKKELIEKWGGTESQFKNWKNRDGKIECIGNDEDTDICCIKLK